MTWFCSFSSQVCFQVLPIRFVLKFSSENCVQLEDQKPEEDNGQALKALAMLSSCSILESAYINSVTCDNQTKYSKETFIYLKLFCCKHKVQSNQTFLYLLHLCTYTTCKRKFSCILICFFHEKHRVIRAYFRETQKYLLKLKHAHKCYHEERRV